jgi:hypothetical protein
MSALLYSAPSGLSHASNVRIEWDTHADVHNHYGWLPRKR